MKLGANAGLSADPTGLKGVFPVDSREEPGDEEFLSQDGIVKGSVADDPEAMKQIQDYVNQGWLEHATRARLQEEYGDDHTISEFCCLTKVKNGKKKKRIILDLKKSGVSKRTRTVSSCPDFRTWCMTCSTFSPPESHTNPLRFLSWTLPTPSGRSRWLQQSPVILLGLMAKIIGNTGVQLMVPVMAHFLGQVLRLYS